jgi:ribonuclease P protein component
MLQLTLGRLKHSVRIPSDTVSLWRQLRERYGYCAKEDLPAKENTKKTGAWLSKENEHPGWSGGSESKASQRPQAINRGLRVKLAGGGVTGGRFITKPGEYALVYEKGKSWVCELLVMRALPNELPLSRYGISVSKRIGKAVVRNRVKRRLREILRIVPLKPGWDIVFIARPAAASADYAGLKRATEGLLTRAHLVETASFAV